MTRLGCFDTRKKDIKLLFVIYVCARVAGRGMMYSVLQRRCCHLTDPAAGANTLTRTLNAARYRRIFMLGLRSMLTKFTASMASSLSTHASAAKVPTSRPSKLRSIIMYL